MSEQAAPQAEYRDRRDARLRDVASRETTDRRLSLVRLFIFIVAAVLAWPTIFTRTVAWPWLLLPVAAFIAVAIVHEGVARRLAGARRAAAYYDRGLARLDDRWAGEGIPGDEFGDPGHPYARDLDLFGRGSLFDLVCTCRTRVGERTLATWFREAADPAEIRLRQEAVRELRDRLDLREELALLGEEVRSEDDPDTLARWAGTPPVLAARWPVAVALGLAVVNFGAVGAWFAGDPRWLLVAAVACAIFVPIHRERVNRVLGSVDRAARELELLSGVLARIERESFDSTKLAALRADLDVTGAPPSRRIAQLARLTQLRDSRGNMVFVPIAALGLLGTQLAFAMERWRSRSGSHLARWLVAIGEIEALSALATLSHERPDDPFPEILDEGPLFVGEGLGHPLLSAAACVRNDVELGRGPRMLLVSGSNMSGKSTLMRTVGVNTVLALAGAPVRARRLQISPLVVGACMRVQDSLQTGTSHFYAEIRRLRQVVDLGDGGRPLLFLFDEILHGTNSHDRRIGAEALIRGLVARGAIGIVTTHDLALAKIADELDTARNVHFEDYLEGDRIRFDYLLKPGVVQKSNALDLMRAVGLASFLDSRQGGHNISNS